jgi:GrpB-like predicted nucleotidyltransferase (UPF0157 family)
MPPIIEIVDYDPSWPDRYDLHAARIRAALDNRVLQLEHAGSTSVPGLPAKPVIDIVLAVADSSHEQSYAPALESAGYRLKIREPEWHQHRMFNATDSDVNLHTFSAGCPEIARMLRFRDWLRVNVQDRELYADIKRQLSAREWAHVQEYADAKTQVVIEILKRAEEAG